ncbi:unnamed protein product [Musa acuminata var. zebrina]
MRSTEAFLVNPIVFLLCGLWVCLPFLSFLHVNLQDSSGES